MNRGNGWLIVICLAAAQHLAIGTVSAPRCWAQEGGRGTDASPSRGRRHRPPSSPPATQEEARSAIGPARTIAMNFEKADIVAVLKLLGDAAGVTIAIAPQLEALLPSLPPRISRFRRLSTSSTVSCECAGTP